MGWEAPISPLKPFLLPVSDLGGAERKEKGVAFLDTTGESPTLRALWEAWAAEQILPLLRTPRPNLM